MELSGLTTILGHEKLGSVGRSQPVSQSASQPCHAPLLVITREEESSGSFTSSESVLSQSFFTRARSRA